MKWRRLKYRLGRQLRKPFKGGIAYEWQIGPIVFMKYYFPNRWGFSEDEIKMGRGGLLIRRLGLSIWKDPYWWKLYK